MISKKFPAPIQMADLESQRFWSFRNSNSTAADAIQNW